MQTELRPSNLKRLRREIVASNLDQECRVMRNHVVRLAKKDTEVQREAIQYLVQNRKL